MRSPPNSISCFIEPRRHHVRYIDVGQERENPQMPKPVHSCNSNRISSPVFNNFSRSNSKSKLNDGSSQMQFFNNLAIHAAYAAIAAADADPENTMVSAATAIVAANSLLEDKQAMERINALRMPRLKWRQQQPNEDSGNKSVGGTKPPMVITPKTVQNAASKASVLVLQSGGTKEVAAAVANAILKEGGIMLGGGTGSSTTTSCSSLSSTSSNYAHSIVQSLLDEHYKRRREEWTADDATIPSISTARFGEDKYAHCPFAIDTSKDPDFSVMPSVSTTESAGFANPFSQLLSGLGSIDTSSKPSVPKPTDATSMAAIEGNNDQCGSVLPPLASVLTKEPSRQKGQRQQNPYGATAMDMATAILENNHSQNSSIETEIMDTSTVTLGNNHLSQNSSIETEMMDTATATLENNQLPQSSMSAKETETQQNGTISTSSHHRPCSPFSSAPHLQIGSCDTKAPNKTLSKEVLDEGDPVFLNGALSCFDNPGNQKSRNGKHRTHEAMQNICSTGANEQVDKPHSHTHSKEYNKLDQKEENFYATLEILRGKMAELAVLESSRGMADHCSHNWALLSMPSSAQQYQEYMSQKQRQLEKLLLTTQLAIDVSSATHQYQEATSCVCQSADSAVVIIEPATFNHGDMLSHSSGGDSSYFWEKDGSTAADCSSVRAVGAVLKKPPEYCPITDTTSTLSADGIASTSMHVVSRSIRTNSSVHQSDDSAGDFTALVTSNHGKIVPHSSGMSFSLGTNASSTAADGLPIRSVLKKPSKWFPIIELDSNLDECGIVSTAMGTCQLIRTIVTCDNASHGHEVELPIAEPTVTAAAVQRQQQQQKMKDKGADEEEAIEVKLNSSLKDLKHAVRVAFSSTCASNGDSSATVHRFRNRIFKRLGGRKEKKKRHPVVAATARHTGNDRT